MIKDNFIVITGGPGSGKSTLLNSLSKLGYQCIVETARTIIQDRNERGLTPRPDPHEFARQLFRIDFENFINNVDTNKLIFFDRSFLDSAAMVVETSKTDNHNVIEIVNSYRFSKNVFIAPPWKEIYCNDVERDQSYEDSVKIYEKLYKWYKLNGYALVHIPKLNVDSRTKFVLENTIQHLSGANR